MKIEHYKSIYRIFLHPSAILGAYCVGSRLWGWAIIFFLIAAILYGLRHCIRISKKIIMNVADGESRDIPNSEVD